MADRVEHPEVVLHNIAQAKAALDAVAAGYARAYSLAYEGPKRGNVEKTRRSVGNDNRGLDRAASIAEAAEVTDRFDFDGQEGCRKKLAQTAKAVHRTRATAFGAEHALGALETLLNRRGESKVDTHLAVTDPPKPCQPCRGEGKFKTAGRVQVCGACAGSGIERSKGMTPEEARRRQAQREERAQLRRESGVPFDVAMSELG